MGTNYYFRTNICRCCGRFDEIHVGKSSGTYRAYPNELLNVEYPEWGYTRESPFGFPVLSMTDWRRVFLERKGELWNEYNEQIKNPFAWLADQRPWLPNPAYGREYLNEDIRLGIGWLDAQGYKFYAGEFS